MTYLDQYTDAMVKSKPKRARHRVSTKAASCSSAGSSQGLKGIRYYIGYVIYGVIFEIFYKSIVSTSNLS